MRESAVAGRLRGMMPPGERDNGVFVILLLILHCFVFYFCNDLILQLIHVFFQNLQVPTTVNETFSSKKRARIGNAAARAPSSHGTLSRRYHVCACLIGSAAGVVKDRGGARFT